MTNSTNSTRSYHVSAGRFACRFSTISCWRNNAVWRPRFHQETRKDKPYLRITESRKDEGDKFERNSINVFPEDADESAQAVFEMTAKLG